MRFFLLSLLCLAALLYIDVEILGWTPFADNLPLFDPLSLVRITLSAGCSFFLVTGLVRYRPKAANGLEVGPIFDDRWGRVTLLLLDVLPVRSLSVSTKKLSLCWLLILSILILI